MNICFTRLERHVAEALGASAPSTLTATLRSSQMVPQHYLYGDGAFLVNLESPTATQASEATFYQLILQYMEPVRMAHLKENCLGDPSFFPHDSVSLLSWELGRVAYLSLVLSRQRFESYAKNLLCRIDEYEEGLEHGESGFEQHETAARRSIAELRQIVRFLHVASS